jgi:dipeptidyl aminopeptidase/acylaminoacyl peptidase
MTLNQNLKRKLGRNLKRSLKWNVAVCWLLAAACGWLLTPDVATAQEDPNRPSAITATGVPEVPSEVFERLNQYQNVRQADFSGWSPDGTGILIGTRFDNATQLHRVFEPGGRRQQVTFFPEPVGGRFLPRQQDGDLLVTMSAGGNENYQVYLLTRENGRSTLLTDGTSRNRLGPVNADGTRMIIHGNRRNGRDTDLYVADCRRPDSEQLIFETDGEFWVATDWSQDGSRLLMLHYVSINESYPALLEMSTRTMTPIKIPAQGKTAFGTLRFSPDGASAYVTCDARGEFLTLARVDLKTMEYTWLTEDIPWDVDQVEVDPESGQVAFTANDDGASRLYLLEGDQHREVKVPLGILSSLEFSPDGKSLGFTLARPDAPSDAYSLDLADGKLTRWTYSEVGGLNPDRFVRPERIQFSSFDGREIPAYYYRPREASDQRPAPVLIKIHGGPESQFRPYFSGITQYFVNELGLAVIAPNVRGSDGYGKTYLQLDNGIRREDSVRDIGALLDWIEQQPELDASRVAVIGGSYGGYMVLGSLTNYPTRIRAGIDIVGIASFISFLERTSPYRQDLRRAEYGDERDPKLRAFFERIDPLSNAEKIRSALLVAHGVNDPRVPFFEAQQIATKVRDAGQEVWTVYADNEGHGFRKKDNRDYLLAVEVMFLARHLNLDIGGVADSRPEETKPAESKP